MGQTIGQRFERLMDDHFVGRTFETELFRQFLERLEEKPERILNVFGTAGMGKTYLLDRFAAITRELNALPVPIAIGETLNDPGAVCRLILQGLGQEAVEGNENAADRSIQAVQKAAETRKVVLLFDGYEEAAGLDHWLRTRYLPNLPPNVLIVIAGRYALEGPWRHTPAWKRIIVRLPLSELTYEDIRKYMRHWEIENEEKIDAVWLRTLGHPLAMSLLTPLPAEAAAPGDLARIGTGTTFEAMLDHWLQEAPDDELRELLFAASVTRSFSQELLSEMTGKAVPPTLFDRLIRLSFISRGAGGWRLHDIVWETLRNAFRDRLPDTFDRYSRRAVEYGERKIGEGIRRGEDISRTVAELLHFSGNPVMRAHYRHAGMSPHYREPLHAGNAPELAAYLKRRREQPRAWHVRCSDPESRVLYRFDFSPEESLLRLSGFAPGEGPNWPDGSVELLRNEVGRVIGLFVVVPVREDTWEFLSSAPISRAFFRRLNPGERRELIAAGERNQAWYLYGVDVEDLENEQLRSDIVRHLFDRVLAGNLIITSAPPLPYYDAALTGLGFEVVPEAEHDDYGIGKPARTYWLDTRNEKLQAFLKRMTGREPDAERAEDRRREAADPAGFRELTERERDVARLLAAGNTNQEIAASLFVSEAAVKKHVNAMLSKFGLKNRTQLARLFFENRPAGTEGSDE
ncbi:LuxR family transcriptional regulator [Cohnella sp. CFH 77786]|uniref:LuxR family transcriptional regulator n=1 Tax=Cohnella sp. CFH 77786 TaxID=2662265 RepID=UPI001C608B20|nr:LuxR family transcriptional regulator [Cohnella sp. CFH 77786]MBW5448425.1 LuxR family transcriptional regulator [Cohnella sp. CFH 77786]